MQFFAGELKYIGTNSITVQLLFLCVNFAICRLSMAYQGRRKWPLGQAIA